MDNRTQELSKEDLAQSEKRKERKERKKLKKEATRNKPPLPPHLDNSRFLARPWIALPEVNETLVQHKARVMTWNVRTTASDIHSKG